MVRGQASEASMSVEHQPQGPEPPFIVLPPCLHGRLYPLQVSDGDSYWDRHPTTWAAEHLVKS